YDKKITLPGKQKRAVYTAVSSSGDGGHPYDDIQDGEYKVFQVDTDISDIMAYNTDMNRFANRKNTGKSSSGFLSCDEWNKLSQE
ncbi:MAG: hypothetical protein ACEQSA_06995, partial [Weeksellaceae bacterium]